MSGTSSAQTLTRFPKNRVSYKVRLSERAQNPCGQEGWCNVCWWFLDVGPKNIHNSGKKRRVEQEWTTDCRGFHDPVFCFFGKTEVIYLFCHRRRRMMLSEQFFTLPVDGMAHARNESGQEHKWLPVWRFFTRDTTHITVRPAVTLKYTEILFYLHRTYIDQRGTKESTNRSLC